MNRKERRAAAKRSATNIRAPDLFARAQQLFRQGVDAQAEAFCEQILEREPAHIGALNLAGLIAQSAGRHRVAAKLLGKAVATDPGDAACHYNLAVSYQALGERGRAEEHFLRTLTLGMSGKKVENFIERNPVIGACLARLERKWPIPINNAELFGAHLTSIAADAFLRCALETVPVQTPRLEAFLTQLRSALLSYAASVPASVDDDLIDLSCALAQQCFINEYVYAQTEAELDQIEDLQSRVSEIKPLALAAIASYRPLCALADATQLLSRDWPPSVRRLLRQQIVEPLEEIADRPKIPALTVVDNPVSIEVQRQYEENPYPRWTQTSLAGVEKGSGGQGEDILIAGCGTGKHPIEIAHCAPHSRILALDISRASLAYARRKTREAGISNIEYAQADLMELGSLGRSFDIIECAGVLHHLADPLAGWRVLLRLLKPGGRLFVGLYSELARQFVVEARAFIAAREYRPRPDDIRSFRQELLRGEHRGRWQELIGIKDFYSMSGCRDLIFNVMEHRFTIPQIKRFLDDEGLIFEGFESSKLHEAFSAQYPNAAFDDLDVWHEFETRNPTAFREMYQFWTVLK